MFNIYVHIHLVNNKSTRNKWIKINYNYLDLIKLKHTLITWMCLNWKRIKRDANEWNKRRLNCCDYLHPIGNYKVLDGWFYGTLYYFYVIFHGQILKKNSDIIKCDSDMCDSDHHYGNRFQTFMWQYQGVTTNKCDIIKGRV